jgi:hypothetical protein
MCPVVPGHIKVTLVKIMKIMKIIYTINCGQQIHEYDGSFSNEVIWAYTINKFFDTQKEAKEHIDNVLKKSDENYEHRRELDRIKRGEEKGKYWENKMVYEIQSHRLK